MSKMYRLAKSLLCLLVVLSCAQAEPTSEQSRFESQHQLELAGRRLLELIPETERLFPATQTELPAGEGLVEVITLTTRAAVEEMLKH